MATNQILEFAGAVGALKYDYATYYADSQREPGHQYGLARAELENSVLNQVSKLAVVLSQFVVDESGNDVLHTDSTATILANLQLAIEAKIAEASSGFTPSGTVRIWPTESVPTGFLECDGSSLLRASYPDLFAVIGTEFGYADATHFNLPDFRGVFMRGWDHGAGVDPAAATRTDRGDGTTGDHTGTKQDDELASHRHTLGKQMTPSDSSDTDYFDGSGAAPTTTLYTAYTGGNETRPVNTNVMFIIKY